MKSISGLSDVGILLSAFMLLWFASDFVGDYGLQIAFRVLIYLALAESWNLLAGSVGLVSLGTSCFVGLGAYVAFGISNRIDVPLPLVLVGCAVAGGALAALVSPALFRLRGLYFTVGTLALAELLRLTMVNISAFGGAMGIFLQKDPPPLPVLYHYALSVALIASIAITACARTRVSLVAIAGGVQATKLGAIEPYGIFGLQWSIDVLSMVIIGGVGLRLGPLVGALFVVALGETLADYPEAHVAITGVILILLIRFAPQGVVGFAANLSPPTKKRAVA
jgi:branched-chain amino acid transport system permease protein